MLSLSFTVSIGSLFPYFYFRMETLKSSKARQDFDGLNTLIYKLLEVKEEKLYTHVKVKLTKQMYSFQLQQCLHQNS